MLVRPADPHRDAAACAAIYAPHVDPGTASFEDVAPDAEEMARRMGAAHLWLVAERDGDVAGYAYGGRHRDRSGYRWTVETAVYVAGDHAGRGVGRALYDALLPELRRRGYRLACAGVTLPNQASVALHEAVGFEPVGVYRRIGFKHGRWWDVGWWQLDLAGGDDAPPAEPAP
jgi:L-amino acid N-acyltransferase YncA